MTISGHSLLNIVAFALSLVLVVVATLGGPSRSTDADEKLAVQVEESGSSRARYGLILLAGLCAATSLATLLLNLRRNRAQAQTLRLLREGAQRIAGGEFKARIPAADTAEFSALAADFNQMAARLSALYADLERQALARGSELARSEQLTTVDFLAGRVAHEINNPLNIITGYAELSLRQTDHPLDPQMLANMRQALQIIREEGFRCKTVTEKLLLLARAENRHCTVVAVARLVEEVAELLRHCGAAPDCRVRVELPPGDDLAVWGSYCELRQIALHLGLNALKAAPPGRGEVLLQGARHGREIEIGITDNGRGITREVLEHTFGPFFSDRQLDGETELGLGLCVAKAVIQAHGGRITAESDGPGRGSRFTLRLPAHPTVQVGGEKAA